MSSFVWTSVTWESFKESGKIAYSVDRLMMKLSRFNDMLALSLSVVTWMLNEPKSFPLCSWDVSLCTSSSLVRLSKNELRELFPRKILDSLFEPETVYDKLEPISIKKLKALAISVIVISLPFTLIMFRQI